MTEVISSETSHQQMSKENAAKAETYGGKRFLGFTPKGAEVWVSMEVDRETLDLKVKATHDLNILLQEGAQMTDKRVSIKKGKQFVGSVDDLLRRSQKNQGGKVTIETLQHIQRLINAVDSKFDKAYVNGKPSSLLFSYVAWSIFEGSYDMDRGDTSWFYIKESFKFPKNGEYFTVESLPLFIGQFEEPKEVLV